MKLTVGICDDCAAHLALMEKYISGYQGGDTLQIVKSTDPQRFLEMAQTKNPRLVFLDIDMIGMDGIELGGKIKAIDADAIIIYVTAHEKYALEAFRVRAFHYLIKPVTKDKVTAALTEALTVLKRESRKESGKTFAVQRKGETVTLPIDDILYFEKVGHKIRAITVGGYEEYYGNFTPLIEQLGAEEFIQCHQGYIVSVAKIRALRDKTLFLDGGLQVPVSRTFMEKVRDSLARRLFTGKDGV